MPHEAVLVPVHSRQLTNTVEGLLQPIRELIRIDISQTILNMRIHNQLGQSQNLMSQMEGITKPRLLPLLRSKCLGRLQIEVIIQILIIQLLAIDQQIQHIVPLPANLQPHLHLIQLGALKELGRLQALEQHLLILLHVRTRVQFIQHPILEQLLVGHPDLGGSSTPEISARAPSA